MPNLAELMKGRIEDLVKGPPVVPVADYPAVILKGEKTTARNEEKTDILRLTARIIDWPQDDSLTEEQKARIENISQRTIACDYWFPLDYRFGRLCQQCGLSGEISEQTIGELTGKHVIASVVHQVSKKTGETWAIARTLTGQG